MGYRVVKVRIINGSLYFCTSVREHVLMNLVETRIIIFRRSLILWVVFIVCFSAYLCNIVSTTTIFSLVTNGFPPSLTDLPFYSL